MCVTMGSLLGTGIPMAGMPRPRQPCHDHGKAYVRFSMIMASLPCINPELELPK